MPRNNQIIRQWHLLRKLEGSRGVTLQELVGSIPEDYPRNPRTIRRDLEAGVFTFVKAQWGQG